MATTIVPASLTIKITESITLNGVDQGGAYTRTISGITEIVKRIVNVPTSEIAVLTFTATTPGSVTIPGLNEADVRYIRITNLDDTNFIQIIIASDDNAECAHKLEAGGTMIIPVSAEGVVSVHDADRSALTVSFDDITAITALADSSTCDLEYLVAGV